jgi:uncharacterized sporulation protein YeaH/YhbH (DUF444 family)
MLHIIDRRFNSTNKSSVNRQRLMKRVQARIKEAVEEAVSKRAMDDLGRGGEVSVPKADISEPVFGHGSGGQVTHVLPGNKQFKVGDKMMRPSGRGGGNGGAGEQQITGDRFPCAPFPLDAPCWHCPGHRELQWPRQLSACGPGWQFLQLYAGSQRA